MDLLDAHHHLWDVSERDYPWMDGPWADPLRGRFDMARLTPHLMEVGVVETIVVQALSSVAETRRLLAIADAAPPIAGVVGWVDLMAGDGIAVELADARGLVGIRHQVQDEPDPQWLLRPEVLAGLAAVADAGLVYDLLVTPRELPAAISVAQRLPQLSFVLDHLGKPQIADGGWQPWADQLAALAALPNVTAKISGLVTEAGPDWAPAHLAPYVRHAVEVFGPDRLIWGSDWPVCTLAAEYDELFEVTWDLLDDLSQAEKSAVFGGNARRVYLER